MTRRLCVVGNGMVAATFLEEFCARRPDRLDITVFGAEPRPAYDRIRLSTVLAGGCDADALTLLDRSWYRRNGVLLRDGVTVTAIDRENRQVVADDGSRTDYDELVLATGSDPVIPPIEGMSRRGVHTFRSLDDVDAMIAAAAPDRRACVVGGGLLGLEAAYGLGNRGMRVTVVHLVDRLMERQLDSPGARVLLGEVRSLGIDVHLAAETAAVLGNGHAEGVRLRDGRALDADLVVVACGVRPAAAIARAAGLGVHRGIEVDDNLATSDPSIFAIGECSEHGGVVHGLVAPLRVQARVLAARMQGNQCAGYRGGTGATTLKVAGVHVFSAGAVEAHPDDEMLTLEDTASGVYKRVLVRDGRVHGAILVGDLTTAPRITALIGDGAPVGAERLALVAPPTGVSAASAAAGMADDAVVCGCNGVTKRDICDAITAKGCATRGDVTRCTRAAGSCGSCGSVVDALLSESGQAEAGERPAEPAICACVPVSKRELREEVLARDLRSVSAVLDALGNGTGCARCRPALSYHLDVIRCGDYDEERASRFINDRVHANIQRDGTFSVVPRMFGGVTTPAQLRRIADVAERFDVPMVKVTGGQRIDLLGIPKEQLPAVWEALDMPSGHAYAKAVRTVKTCVGTDFCRFGVGDSTALGIALEKAIWGLYTPHKVKSAVTGCPRNCAEATVKDIGVMAIATGWELYVGGAAGMSVRRGDRLCTVGDADEALRSCLLFFQHYREDAEYLERTYAYMERVGLEAVRAATVDASPEVQAGLLDRFAASRRRVRDPWLEGAEPRTSSQFVRPGLPAAPPPPAVRDELDLAGARDAGRSPLRPLVTLRR
ncbi:MAG TPA: nitrite reductase large subunit NirB [Candidatus Dormibacteraeota bacterium]|nr:nitrite reductase large subunit NirB [Candidatus Dormibacteraeota bacterium]